MEHFLDTKDFLVSEKSFSLMRDPLTGVLMTTPRPSDPEMYYQSDDYLSHNDSAKGLTASVYRFVRKINLARKLKLIDKYAAGERSLLDFGAGTGDLLQLAKQKGYKIAGLEPNAGARASALEKGIELSEVLPTDKEFKIITLWHVLEHLPDPEAALIRIRENLREEGVIFIAVPNYNSFDATYYREFWAAYDVPRHLWHFSKQAIRTLVEKQGMEIAEIKPMHFDAYYISLLSEKYKTGSHRYLKAAYTGWRSNREARKSGEYSSLLYIIRKRP
jgi:2-polyprenyl-3-methyl-5-hydroxy-6-metoxy-1,4-benzoquinol methylase